MIALLIIFTLASSFFSLAQIALFSLSSTEVKLYRAGVDKRKQLIARLLSRPRELLVTLLMCDIGANIFVQNTAATLFGQYSGWWLKVGVPLALTLIIGEILPKTIAMPNNGPIAYRVAPIIGYIQRLLGPLRTLLTNLTSHLSRILFFFLQKEKEISIEELHHVLKRSERHGILSKEEAELVDGYLDLSDTTVKERMHPREEIFYYDIEDPLSKLIYFFVEKECSRLPICKGDLQTLLGIFEAHSFFIHRKEIEESKDVLRFLKKPTYVPETILTRTLLRQFLQSDEKVGIVVDEYGSITGLITQEDLFEVVVGEIADRREKLRFTPAGKETIISSGKFELAEFEEHFGIALPTESNVVTIGGWLTEQLGDIPKSGTKYRWGNFLFHVLAADPTRVRRVYIRKLKEKEDA